MRITDIALIAWSVAVGIGLIGLFVGSMERDIRRAAARFFLASFFFGPVGVVVCLLAWSFKAGQVEMPKMSRLLKTGIVDPESGQLSITKK